MHNKERTVVCASHTWLYFILTTVLRKDMIAYYIKNMETEAIAPSAYAHSEHRGPGAGSMIVALLASTW
jgi:hypothetical protein